jgi:hypothetical protein
MTELTIVASFRDGREPEEEEVRQLIEDEWLGVLIAYDTEEV